MRILFKLGFLLTVLLAVAQPDHPRERAEAGNRTPVSEIAVLQKSGTGGATANGNASLHIDCNSGDQVFAGGSITSMPPAS